MENVNSLIYDIHAYIAILLSFSSIYLLARKKINITTYLIYTGISIIMCLVSIYSSALLADNLNLSASSNLLNLSILNGVSISIGLFFYFKPKSKIK